MSCREQRMVGRYGDVFGAARTLCSGAALSNVRVKSDTAVSRQARGAENVQGTRSPGLAAHRCVSA